MHLLRVNVLYEHTYYNNKRCIFNKSNSMFNNTNIVLSSPLEEFGSTWYIMQLFNNINFSTNTILLQLLTLNIIYIIILLPADLLILSTNMQAVKLNFFLVFINFYKDGMVSVRMFKLLPFFLSIFYLILFSNMSGLYHFGKPISGQIILTLFVSLVSFLSLIIFGFLIYKISFLTIIMPKNDLPWYLLYFITLIEFFSFIIRPFSLAIRLFANMLAGHMLMVLVGTFLMFLFSYFFLFNLPIIIAAIIIIVLEIFVSFIQAYVFLTLFLIYLNQVYDIFSH